ncbi:MAG TPA: hypothetical protein VM184_11705 [Gaiellaceae bacterium]|nr:hypothetical protein [Gaiellaceae bacterium]
MADENGTQGTGRHLLFVWSPNGWTLRERDGEPPARGATVEEDDVVLLVSKIGPSPFPGDRRRCAYTQLA